MSVRDSASFLFGFNLKHVRTLQPTAQRLLECIKHMTHSAMWQCCVHIAQQVFGEVDLGL